MNVLDRIAGNSITDPVSGCINWVGNTLRGYGTIKCGSKVRRVHVVAWEAVNGPVPAGMELDHRCHAADKCSKTKDCSHRSCWNVAHLVPVVHRENLLRGNSPVGVNARKTHCIHGHAFTPENTRVGPPSRTRPSGRRICRTCTRIRNRARRARNREVSAGSDHA